MALLIVLLIITFGLGFLTRNWPAVSGSLVGVMLAGTFVYLILGLSGTAGATDIDTTTQVDHQGRIVEVIEYNCKDSLSNWLVVFNNCDDTTKVRFLEDQNGEPVNIEDIRSSND